MRVGAVDIGTNTARLLVAERHGGGLFPVKLEELDRRVVIVGLGRGVDASGSLAEASMPSPPRRPGMPPIAMSSSSVQNWRWGFDLE